MVVVYLVYALQIPEILVETITTSISSRDAVVTVIGTVIVSEFDCQKMVITVIDFSVQCAMMQCKWRWDRVNYPKGNYLNVEGILDVT